MRNDCNIIKTLLMAGFINTLTMDHVMCSIVILYNARVKQELGFNKSLRANCNKSIELLIRHSRVLSHYTHNVRQNIFFYAFRKESDEKESQSGIDKSSIKPTMCV